MMIFFTENMRKTITIVILSILTIVSIILVIISWQQYNKSMLLQHKFARLEKSFSSQKELLAKQSAVTNLQAQLDKLQQNLVSVYNKVDNFSSFTNPGSASDLKSVLLLTKLTAVQLFLNKDLEISKDLLSQAINKLTKINDPSLNIVLYNLQDQYSTLDNTTIKLYKNQQIIDKIEHIGNLLNLNVQTTDPSIEPEPTTSKFLDLIKISHLKADQHNSSPIQADNYPGKAKLSTLQIETIKLYLEQIKLSYLQNNDLLFKHTIASIKNILAISELFAGNILEIQNELDWLENLTIPSYKLILQAILQLEDYIK